MNAIPLNPVQRREVLAAVQDALSRAGVGRFETSDVDLPDFSRSLERHLDALVEISRRTTSDRIEPYLCQVLDDVCDKCPHQLPSAYCPLRNNGGCVLFHCAQIIFDAIGETLRRAGDAEYLEHHPRATTRGNVA